MLIKIAKYPRLIFVSLFLLLYFITYIFGVENAVMRTVFSVTLAFVLSPQKKSVKTQTETKTQVTWFLLKEPIILD